MKTNQPIQHTDKAHVENLMRLTHSLIAAILYMGVDKPLLNNSDHWRVVLELLECKDFDSLQVQQLHGLAALIEQPAVLQALVYALYSDLAAVQTAIHRPLAA